MLYPPMGEWDILKTAISECGEKHQIIIAIEELSELIKELTKYLRNGDNEEHLTEEMADVELCISLLMGGDYVDFDAVMELIEVKDKRWHERLREARHEEH